MPVAQALAQAHAAGLVHGALTPASVLVAASGMPLLGDLGSGDGTPEGDVRALVELCCRLLGATRPLGAPDGPVELPDDVPPGLAAVLEEARAEPPSAAELAQRLRAGEPAAPLRTAGSRPQLGSPLPGSREWVAPAGPRTHRVRRGRRRLWPAVVLLVLASVAAWALLRPAPAPTARPDWAAVVQELDRVRERAWAAADPELLRAVYASGTAAGQTDAAALERLRGQGRTAVGVRHRVVGAQARSVTDARVELRVVDVLGPQEVRDARGRLVERRPGRGARAYDVVLLRTAEGWRVEQVSSPVRGWRAGPARDRGGRSGSRWTPARPGPGAGR